MSENKALTFDDTVVSTIAKTLQLAMITGTDIVDNLKRIEVQESTIIGANSVRIVLKPMKEERIIAPTKLDS